ncbi:hypothetical protein EVAR_26801_1 [Eumeta japonica]|uniref:Uncharacterized protein n=1 Tax=Eumeta variegata TaxID=151549 RepID=A0A4C1WDG8_EUMVA|nr:hypothetical protein EVAR_26801_1 [Eumeta japonica]
MNENRLTKQIRRANVCDAKIGKGRLRQCKADHIGDNSSFRRRIGLIPRTGVCARVRIGMLQLYTSRIRARALFGLVRDRRDYIFAAADRREFERFTATDPLWVIVDGLRSEAFYLKIQCENFVRELSQVHCRLIDGGGVYHRNSQTPDALQQQKLLLHARLRRRGSPPVTPSFPEGRNEDWRSPFRYPECMDGWMDGGGMDDEIEDVCKLMKDRRPDSLFDRMNAIHPVKETKQKDIQYQ